MISNITQTKDKEIVKKLNNIVLLRLKTLIVRGLRKEQLPEFERIVKSGDSNHLLQFAGTNIPNFSRLFSKELEEVKQEIYK